MALPFSGDLLCWFRSRSGPGSRALSKQPSRADLNQPVALDHTLLNSALAQDAAAARLAGDYLAAVHSAASLQSAAASSAVSWPQESDLPADVRSCAQQRVLPKENCEAVTGSDWQQVLRQGVELAQGMTTDQFLQVVDLYPEHSLGQV